MKTLNTIIPSSPSTYFIPPAANLNPISHSMSPISPDSTTTTTPLPNGAVPMQEDQASNMLAAALGITDNNGGNTNNDSTDDTNEGSNENVNGNVNVNVNGNAGANSAPHAKYVPLYVGDLSATVKDENLFEFFQKENLKIFTVKVCRDAQTGESLGYGYANFLTHEDASLAIEKLNHKVFCTKPIRLMWSIRDSEARRNGIGNLFVKNLNLSCDNERLDEIFAKVGTVLSVKVVRNIDGSSRGYGFVQFETEELADAAIVAFHDKIVDGNKLSVKHFVKKSDRMGTSPDGFTNLYIKNLDEDIDEELVRLKFSQFGPIVSVMIARDDNGISKGFAFVCFENPDSAKKAVDTMNGLPLGNKALYVSKAQKKGEREQFLLSQKQERLKEWHRKTMGANVYVKNLHEDVDDMALKNHFSQCGTINSAKVMRNDQGVSKGFGFVCYNSPEEAQKAIATLNRQFFHNKPLYVAMAESKEDRKARLQRQFTTAMPTTSYTSSNGYLPTTYTSLYYSPSRANVVSNMPYSQGLMTQSFPLGPVGTIGTVWRSTGTYFPASTSPTAYRQRNMVMKYVPCGRFDANYSETMLSPEASTSRTSSMEVEESLCTANNATGTIDQQRLLLRDRLFPQIEKFKPEFASKIMEHLMEMEKAELVALVENPELVSAKVEDVVRLIELENSSYVSAPSALNQ
ncbi:polyadenylate-binding protein 7 isoform X2 [Carex littledalei]|uniref:Polyadenylate-binding protein 7 isoform X2 n=1 Tax=Carex littledalei TaxID=544730 RepID=A0A833V3V6_9POAL|nr:polyadenylate-binding protein 7 isoform X2 [Carex littledalei]